MAITRNNILSLIGGNGRYHSCILTTFSFYFYFFEMKVMKWLRSCEIRNVNVFIDGHFYSEFMKFKGSILGKIGLKLDNNDKKLFSEFAPNNRASTE